MSKAVTKTKSGTTPTTTDNYTTLVKQVAELCTDCYGNLLRFYWSVGGSVLKLVNEPGNYGNHTVEKFADDLDKTAGGAAIGKDSLYKAKNMREALTEEQLQMAIDAHMSLSNILPLCCKHVDPDTRNSLLLKAKENYNKTGGTIDVRDALSTATADKPSKTSTAPSDAAVVKSYKAVKVLSDLLAKLEERIRVIGDDVVTVCESESEDKIVAVREYFDADVNAMDSLIATWRAQVMKANAAIKKTKHIK
jgi:hypothetical protein